MEEFKKGRRRAKRSNELNGSPYLPLRNRKGAAQKMRTDVALIERLAKPNNLPKRRSRSALECLNFPIRRIQQMVRMDGNGRGGLRELKM